MSRLRHMCESKSPFYHNNITKVCENGTRRRFARFHIKTFKYDTPTNIFKYDPNVNNKKHLKKHSLRSLMFMAISKVYESGVGV